MSHARCLVQLRVNGRDAKVEAPPMMRLLDLLREELGLTGTKEGCGEGECGSCSVLLNGELVNSCLVPAIQAQNARIDTVEGLTIDAELHPLQKAFLECGGAQCGICTPGMLMAATYLLQRSPHPTLEEVREGLAGNLCRCTGFIKIFESVLFAATLQSGATPDEIRRDETRRDETGHAR